MIIFFSAQCHGRVLTVEDHVRKKQNCAKLMLMYLMLMYFQYPEGGLGDAVLASLAMVRNTVVKKLAVNSVPRSGNIRKRKNN